MLDPDELTKLVPCTHDPLDWRMHRGLGFCALLVPPLSGIAQSTPNFGLNRNWGIIYVLTSSLRGSDKPSFLWKAMTHSYKFKKGGSR